MKTLKDFIVISEFLGSEMTEEQTTRLIDEAKQSLSISELEILTDNVSGSLYTELSQHRAEMGGYSRY